MAKHIVKVKEHKVQDGDTVESIAKAAGLTVSELAKFNWGSDSPDKINIALRDRVGARAKEDDKKSFKLSKDDDPGIIYIPQTVEPKSFAANSTHTITVRKPGKEFKTAYTTVRFRPKADWKGEDYGFDWFRAADFPVCGLFNNLDFDKSIFGKLYIPPGAAAASQTLQPDGNSYTGDFRADATMLENAKKNEYKRKKIKDAANKDVEVFASHINIYINEKDLKPPKTVELQAFVNNSNEVLDELVFDIKDADAAYVKLSTTANLKKMAIKNDEKIKLNLEVLKPIKKQIEVVAKAITRHKDGAYLEHEAGRLIIHPNDKKHRKHVKILLIEVKSPPPAAGGTPETPNMTNQKELFTKLLRQALVNPVIRKPNLVLDVSADKHFIKHFTQTNAGKLKILAYKTDASGMAKVDGKYYSVEDYLLAKLKKRLEAKKSSLADKLDNYIKAFYFGADGKMDDNGTDVNLNGYSTEKFVVMFKSRNEGTSPHEFLHSLGLPHTFDTGASADDVSKNAKFSYKYAQTENIMDYSHHRAGHDNARVTTFHWQWAIVNGHSYTRPNDD